MEVVLALIDFYIWSLKKKILKSINISNDQLLPTLPLCVHTSCVWWQMYPVSVRLIIFQLDFPFNFKNKLPKIRIYIYSLYWYLYYLLYPSITLSLLVLFLSMYPSYLMENYSACWLRTEQSLACFGSNAGNFPRFMRWKELYLKLFPILK